MKLFHVDSSARRERSNSRTLARRFIENLRSEGVDVEVDYLDVTVDTPPHVTEAFAIATYRDESERTPEMRATLAASDALCKRLFEADAFLFAMPMYNWSMPSTFKAFIDSVTRTGVTYKSTEHGRTVGQLNHQKVLFITTRGADLRPGNPFSSMDALTPALKTSFGFIGVTDLRFVDAQPLQFSDQEARIAALERAHAELVEVATEWAASEHLRLAAQARKVA
ncbi:MAG TPA: NAD(P)H-dependent oxidoreductase [Paraburkholderia sp.]|jgi:FMN-dependent NADH-azoreductase